MQQLKTNKWIHRLNPGYRALGLEITDTSIKLLQTYLAGGGFTVERFAEARLPDGAIDDGKIIDTLAVTQTIHSLVSRESFETKQVHFVLPSSLAMVRFIKIPNVRDKDLKRMIDFELKYNVPLPFDNVYYDYVKIDDGSPEVRPVKSSRPLLTREEEWLAANREAASASELTLQKIDQCEVMIVAAPTDAIAEYAGLIANSGLKLRSIEIKPLSLHRVIEFMRPEEPLSVFVMVDVTDTYTDVSIFSKGALRISRNIQVKIPSGDKESGGMLAELELANAVQELASEMERLLNYYRYTLNRGDQEIEHILVSGDISALADVIIGLNGRLPYYVSLLEGTNQASSVYLGAFNDRLASLAVPLGLSLRGRNR